MGHFVVRRRSSTVYQGTSLENRGGPTKWAAPRLHCYGNLVWIVRRDFMKYKRIQFLVISIIALLVMSCLVASALDISSSKHFGRGALWP